MGGAYKLPISRGGDCKVVGASGFTLKFYSIVLIVNHSTDMETIYLRGGSYDGEKIDVEEGQEWISLPTAAGPITYIRSDKIQYGFAVFILK